jgi:DNA polymerase-1
VLEETPEAKRLDVNRAKQLAGTKQIKARRMRQDPVTFNTSHTLVINTNNKPVVDETDHGTWRRLAMLCFPFTYRKPGEPCKGPNDRPGDPTLRQRVATNERVAEAALAWMVEGAGKWYAAEQIMEAPPTRVERDTLEWRKESDLVLSFIVDHLEFDYNSHIYAPELFETFKTFLADKGHQPWTDRTFVARFGGHDECAKSAVARKRIRPREGRSTLTPLVEPPNPYWAWLGVKFRDLDENPQLNEGEPGAVPPVPPTPYNPEISPRIGGTEGDGTGGTAPAPHPEADPFGDDPFAEAETPRAATIPAPSPSPETVPPRAGGSVGFDLETHSAKLLFRHKDLGGDPYVRLAGYVTEDGTEVVVNSVDELIKRLVDADELYGHNLLGFDLMALALHHGADYDKLASKTVDTLRWEQTINPPGAAHEKPWATKGYYGLDFTAQRYGINGKTDDLAALAFKHGPEEVGGRKLDKAERTDLGYGRIPVNELSVYFSGDLQATRGVRRALGEPSDYVRREMRVAHLQHRPTLTGWKVDVPVLRELADTEAAKKRESLEWLHDHCGVPLTKSVGKGRGKNRVFTDEPVLSPLSTTAGREAIIQAFADRGANHYPKTASGMISLNKDALGEGSYYVGKGAGGREVPAMLNPNVLRVFAERGADVDALREMCGHIVTVTSSVQKYQEILDHLVGDRIHPQVGDLQGSGRWAYVRPSVTNMAKRGGKVHQRRPLIADDGSRLICFDLDQVDMRAIAGHCQDPAYMANFAPGADAHSMIADAVFGRHDGEWRDNAKRIGHGWNYGMSVKGIANSGVEMELAQRFDDQMNAQYPGLSAWRQEVRDRAAAGQMLDNGFGRLMRCNPDRAWTQAPALMGQGGARDIMCEALLRLVDRAPEATEWLRCVVHDEVVLCVPEHRVEEITATVLDAFTFSFKGVPITAGASKAARDWASCYAKD